MTHTTTDSAAVQEARAKLSQNELRLTLALSEAGKLQIENVTLRDKLATAQERIAELTARGWTMIGEFAKSEAHEWTPVGHIMLGTGLHSLRNKPSGEITIHNSGTWAVFELPDEVRLCRRRPAQGETKS